MIRLFNFDNAILISYLRQEYRCGKRWLVFDSGATAIPIDGISCYGHFGDAVGKCKKLGGLGSNWRVAELGYLLRLLATERKHPYQFGPAFPFLHVAYLHPLTAIDHYGVRQEKQKMTESFFADFVSAWNFFERVAHQPGSYSLVGYWKQHPLFDQMILLYQTGSPSGLIQQHDPCQAVGVMLTMFVRQHLPTGNKHYFDGCLRKKYNRGEGEFFETAYFFQIAK